VLRGVGYPTLRLEEMIYGPDYEPEEERSERSQTMEQSFDEKASRSRDDDTSEDHNERYLRYLRDLEEVCDPEYWQRLHHYSSDSTPESERSLNELLGPVEH